MRLRRSNSTGRFVTGLVVHRRFRQPFTKIFYVRVRPCAAQLGLDGLNLFAQEIILLVLLNLFTDAGLNFFLHARPVPFRAQAGRKPIPAAPARQNSSSTCWRSSILAEHIGGNHIRQLTGILNFQNGLHRLLRRMRPLILQKYSSKQCVCRVRRSASVSMETGVPGSSTSS